MNGTATKLDYIYNIYAISVQKIRYPGVFTDVRSAPITTLKVGTNV